MTTPELRRRFPRSVAVAGALTAVVTMTGCAPLDTLIGGPSVERLDGTATTTPATGPAPYVAGLYAGNGTYTSPNGRENIVVFVTIDGEGVVADVTVTPGANNPTVAFYQGEFAEGIAAEVVGKHLDELDVTRVAGSSLTSGGFREALEQIRSEARP
ncbi:MAG: FMN-binding protein [Microcella sp.]